PSSHRHQRLLSAMLPARDYFATLKSFEKAGKEYFVYRPEFVFFGRANPIRDRLAKDLRGEGWFLERPSELTTLGPVCPIRVAASRSPSARRPRRTNRLAALWDTTPPD